MDWLLNAWWRRPRPKPPADFTLDRSPWDTTPWLAEPEAPVRPALFAFDATPWDSAPWSPSPLFRLDLNSWDAIPWPD